MNFIENIENTLNNEFNLSVTENGALGFKTTGKELLDMNFMVSSMRNMSEDEIIKKYVRAYFENPLLSIKWLFYAGDVRGGLGERRLFKTCFKYIAENKPEAARALIELVPEYTRWDNLLCLLDTPAGDAVVKLISKQLNSDIENMSQNKPVSLLAKWLPSANTSSSDTRETARRLIRRLNFSEKNYRKLLSKLRAYLKVTETYMSAKEWSEIEYSAVPSRANLIYNKAFLRNDKERREAYLESLSRGETKINAGVLFPHDILSKYGNSSSHFYYNAEIDTTLEELWKALPDYVNGNGNTICVADGSGSMWARVGRTGVTCLDVANSLAIYFAERCAGEFKDKYITFSANPQLVDLSKGSSLRDKIQIALSHNEVANTNIEKVFYLILVTAVKGKMKQEDLPSNILIISDMEFDWCVQSDSVLDKRLFEVISDKYKSYGYKLPRLVFWNICSRTGTIPVKENDLGVCLVSGFSPAVAKMVLSNKTDPFEALLEQLNSERYDPVEEKLKNLTFYSKTIK